MDEIEALKDVCVDTDVIVDYLRGREPGRSAFTKWRKKAEMYITSITAFELLLGASLSSKREKRIIEIESLLDQYNILNLTRETAKKAAEKGAGLRAKDIQINIRDLFNASICLARKTPILTKNKTRYERVRDLTVLTP